MQRNLFEMSCAEKEGERKQTIDSVIVWDKFFLEMIVHVRTVWMCAYTSVYRQVWKGIMKLFINAEKFKWNELCRERLIAHN